jgi:hypothetical protein
MDFDEADPFSSNLPGPPFPGEDYVANVLAGLNFPTNLAVRKAVILIELSPDNDPEPFTLKPLFGLTPSNATDHTIYKMNLNLDSFPKGSAMIK